MSRLRPLAVLVVMVAVAILVSARGTVANAAPPQLDVRAGTRAIDAIRHALPDGWETVRIRWGTVPQGWQGNAECVLVEVRDGTTSFTEPGSHSVYHPFYMLWLLPACWEGRMEISTIDPGTEQALYLGERGEFRVLIHSLGHNTWPEGPDALGGALALDTYPLTHRPEHTLDVMAMQKLFQRLDATTSGDLDRWRRQIYGIEEREDVLYLELLTWEDHRANADPTFLGELAEKESLFLSREALAAFPSKRSLYLRRLTRASFSDIIVVNPSQTGS